MERTGKQTLRARVSSVGMKGNGEHAISKVTSRATCDAVRSSPTSIEDVHMAPAGHIWAIFFKLTTQTARFSPFSKSSAHSFKEFEPIAQKGVARHG